MQVRIKDRVKTVHSNKNKDKINKSKLAVEKLTFYGLLDVQPSPKAWQMRHILEEGKRLREWERERERERESNTERDSK